MDETLSHATFEDFGDPFVHVRCDDDKSTCNVYLRPGVFELLDAVNNPRFELGIFTAAAAEYADVVIDRIDPDRSIFKHRLYRDSCVDCNGIYVKDLRVLGRDLDRTVLIDNSMCSFALQLENGMLIQSYEVINNPLPLTCLLPMLKTMEETDDPLGVLREQYDLNGIFKEFVERAECGMFDWALESSSEGEEEKEDGVRVEEGDQDLKSINNIQAENNQSIKANMEATKLNSMVDEATQVLSPTVAGPPPFPISTQSVLQPQVSSVREQNIPTHKQNSKQISSSEDREINESDNIVNSIQGQIGYLPVSTISPPSLPPLVCTNEATLPMDNAATANVKSFPYVPHNAEQHKKADDGAKQMPTADETWIVSEVAPSNSSQNQIREDVRLLDKTDEHNIMNHVHQQKIISTADDEIQENNYITNHLIHPDNNINNNEQESKGPQKSIMELPDRVIIEKLPNVNQVSFKVDTNNSTKSNLQERVYSSFTGRKGEDPALAATNARRGNSMTYPVSSDRIIVKENNHSEKLNDIPQNIGIGSIEPSNGIDINNLIVNNPNEGTSQTLNSQQVTSTIHPSALPPTPQEPSPYCLATYESISQLASTDGGKILPYFLLEKALSVSSSSTSFSPLSVSSTDRVAALLATRLAQEKLNVMTGLSHLNKSLATAKTEGELRQAILNVELQWARIESASDVPGARVRTSPPAEVMRVSKNLNPFWTPIQDHIPFYSEVDYLPHTPGRNKTPEDKLDTTQVKDQNQSNTQQESVPAIVTSPASVSIMSHIPFVSPPLSAATSAKQSPDFLKVLNNKNSATSKRSQSNLMLMTSNNHISGSNLSKTGRPRASSSSSATANFGVSSRQVTTMSGEKSFARSSRALKLSPEGERSSMSRVLSTPTHDASPAKVKSSPAKPSSRTTSPSAANRRQPPVRGSSPASRLSPSHPSKIPSSTTSKPPTKRIPPDTPANFTSPSPAQPPHEINAPSLQSLLLPPRPPTAPLTASPLQLPQTPLRTSTFFRPSSPAEVLAPPSSAPPHTILLTVKTHHVGASDNRETSPVRLHAANNHITLNDSLPPTKTTCCSPVCGGTLSDAPVSRIEDNNKATKTEFVPPQQPYHVNTSPRVFHQPSPLYVLQNSQSQSNFPVFPAHNKAGLGHSASAISLPPPPANVRPLSSPPMMDNSQYNMLGLTNIFSSIIPPSSYSQQKLEPPPTDPVYMAQSKPIRYTKLVHQARANDHLISYQEQQQKMQQHVTGASAFFPGTRP